MIDSTSPVSRLLCSTIVLLIEGEEWAASAQLPLLDISMSRERAVLFKIVKKRSRTSEALMRRNRNKEEIEITTR